LDEQKYNIEIMWYHRNIYMFLKKIIYNFIFEEYWNIALINHSDSGKIITSDDFKWIKHNYKEGWFADPFILNIEDNIIKVLVEEYNYKSKKGRIDCLYIDLATYELKKIKVILETNTHLSFPAIFRTNDKVYIYPENSEDGNLYIYEYDLTTDKLLNKSLILKEAIVDAIIKEIHDNYFLFGTRPKDNNSLLIFESKTLLGKYNYVETLKTNDFTARGAGDWIVSQNMIIRPSQDCKKRYGNGLVFSAVEINKNEKMTLTEKYKFFPRSTDDFDLGVHTFNTYKGWSIVDGYKYKRKIIGNFISLVANKFKRK